MILLGLRYFFLLKQLLKITIDLLRFLILVQSSEHFFHAFLIRLGRRLSQVTGPLPNGQVHFYLGKVFDTGSFLFHFEMEE